MAEITQKGFRMDELEYRKWEAEARVALACRYTTEETDEVLNWFRTIKGSKERDLIGSDAMEGMLTFVAAKGGFDIYNSLMARLFIYAPLILQKLPTDDH